MSSKPQKTWSLNELEAIYDLPFNDLMWKSHSIHREHHDPNEVQISTLMSIKTGGCPEDCKYCSQSIRHDTSLELEKFLSVEEVKEQAEIAKKNGASRFFVWVQHGEISRIPISIKSLK